MTVRVGINGFGRIGRNFWRAVAASDHDIEIVAANDLGDVTTMAHLLKYDSVLGPLHREVAVSANGIAIDGKEIRILAERDPGALPWGDLGVDVVIESTGFFTKAADARKHVDQGGAKKVIISAPANGEDLTIVLGVNDSAYDGSQTIISNASCTTNCLAPLAKVLLDAFGIERGLMTTSTRTRRTRTCRTARTRTCAGPAPRPSTWCPTSTGAAKAIGLVLPELKGKMDGYALRVPVPTGSCTDLTVTLGRERLGRGGQRGVPGGGRRPAQGLPALHRGPDRVLRHRHRPGLLHLRRRPDQGDRRPGQGRRLVRQRVGLLQPARRPGHARRLAPRLRSAL